MKIRIIYLTKLTEVKKAIHILYNIFYDLT